MPLKDSAGDERKFMGEEEGGARRGVPLLGGAAASLCSWPAEASVGLLGVAFRWDERRGVADWELRWRRWAGEDILRWTDPNCGVDVVVVVEGVWMRR